MENLHSAANESEDTYDVFNSPTPGETIALLTEMNRKMKLVEDVTGEEVSEMHARSVLVGILDPGSCVPPTHRHEPFEVI